MNDKKRPIEERIASILGGTAYRDPRDGFGGTSSSSLTNQDIAAALGVVSREHGRTAALVLETHYAGTLVHRATLLRAWEDSLRHRPRDRDLVVLRRFGGELAIRQLAGMKYSTTQLADYAFLLCSRREALQDQVADAYSWLTDIRFSALHALRTTLADPGFLEERKAKKRRVA